MPSLGLANSNFSENVSTFHIMTEQFVTRYFLTGFARCIFVLGKYEYVHISNKIKYNVYWNIERVLAIFVNCWHIRVFMTIFIPSWDYACMRFIWIYEINQLSNYFFHVSLLAIDCIFSLIGFYSLSPLNNARKRIERIRCLNN